MVNNPIISIIVPVYNAERFLHRCIDSILVQTFTEWELILVDDGSKDSSGHICDDYAARDRRIRVFHKKNGGVTSARKIGFENAKGTWIGFVDADDEILPFYYQSLYEVGKIKGCSIACASSENRQITRKDFVSGLLLNRIDWRLPTKLYKRSVLSVSDVFSIPETITIGEDLIGNLFISQNVHSVHMVNTNGYCYRENENSVTHTRNWSLDYETLFFFWVDKALGKERDLFRKELCNLHFQTWRNLVYHGVKVNENVEWINKLKTNRADFPKSLSSRILLYSPGQQCAYILLKVLDFTRKLLRIKG